MLGVRARSFACPHFLSFDDPVPAFQKDVSHRLAPEFALAVVRFGFLDDVGVCPRTDLSSTHLRNNGADRSVRASVHLQGSFSRLHTELEKLPAVLRHFPGLLPLFLHLLPDDRFRGCSHYLNGF